MDNIEEFKQVYDYICFELVHDNDSNIFLKSSFQELGGYYYLKIQNKFPNITVQEINKLLTMFCRVNVLSDQGAYYEELCSWMGIRKQPKNVYVKMKSAIDAIALNYKSVIDSLDNEIRKNNASLFLTKQDIKKIKSKGRNNLFTYDISSEEKAIYDLQAKCNMLRTKKEMLIFVKEYVSQFFSSFCDMEDDNAKELKARQDALLISQSFFDDDEDEAIKAELKPYDSILEMAKEEINNPDLLFYKVKFIPIYCNADKIFRNKVVANSIEEAKYAAQNFLKYLPKLDEFNLYSKTNEELYCSTLKSIVEKYKIVNTLKENISKCICLQNRKSILMNCLDTFTNQNYHIFINLVPIQVEGLFEEFLKDITTFKRHNHI